MWIVFFWLSAVCIHIKAMHVIVNIGRKHFKTNSDAPLFDWLQSLMSKPDETTRRRWDYFLEPFPFFACLAALVSSSFQAVYALLLLHGIILCMRSACFVSTLLPDSSQCGKLDSVLPISGGLYDLMFSGHVASALLGSSLTFYYQPDIGLCLYALCVIQSTATVLHRKHYSVDVLAAWWVVPTLVYTVMHLPVLKSQLGI